MIARARAFALAALVGAAAPSLAVAAEPAASASAHASAPSAAAPSPPAPATSAAEKATPDKETSTPLALRTGRTSPAGASDGGLGIGTKLGLIGLVLAGGLYLWRRRNLQRLRPPARVLRIVQRTSIGVRTELLVVEVEGERLLLGVTPQSIQSLATLSPATAASDEVDAPEARRALPQSSGAAQGDGEPAAERPRSGRMALEEPRSGQQPALDPAGSRFRAMLDSALPKAAARATRQAVPPESASAPPVEGQARGLVGLRGRK